MLKPLGDKIIVKREEKNNTTDSGIMLSNNSKEKSRIAIVVAVGKTQKNSDGSICEPEVKVGDKVFLNNYVDDIIYNGEELAIVNQDEILAIIE